jgi:hypothetical protein
MLTGGSLNTFDFSKTLRFRVANFCDELAYLSKQKWMIRLQIPHGTRYNVYLAKGFKIEVYSCRIGL